jgi:hypothetical protein
LCVFVVSYSFYYYVSFISFYVVIVVCWPSSFLKKYSDSQCCWKKYSDFGGGKKNNLILTWRGGYGFLFRSEFFFRTTQELEYLFFVTRSANFFSRI